MRSGTAAFRVDASVQIGTGHVMRCLTLANALRERGMHCLFICRAHVGHLAEFIKAAGFDVCLLPVVDEFQPSMNSDDYALWLGCSQAEDATQTQACLGAGCDWLVVDHYGLDASWERKLRGRARHILAIDDLASRTHECELLLDQNLGRIPKSYDGLLPFESKRLIGTEFALLRPEFAVWRAQSLAHRRQSALQQLLVTLGGVDKDNMTGRVLSALVRGGLPPTCRVTVVMGASSPWLQAITDQATNLPFACEVKVDVRNMAELMANSDLAVGAAGSTAWERCCLGLPSVALVLAENQQAIAKALDNEGAAVMLPEPDSLPDAMSRLLDGGSLQTMSQLASRLVDGHGCQRVVAAMEMVE